MKVLVTGAAGLIGRAVTRACNDADVTVVATDLRKPPSGAGLPGWEQLDIRRPEQVREVLHRHEPEAVIHLAARHFIPFCNRYPAATLQTNVVGTYNVAKVTLGELGGRLIFASSAAVYGPSSEALGEDDPLQPDDVYGLSKLLGEQVVAAGVRASGGGDGAVILRFFNTIGPGDPNAHLIPRLMSELRSGRRTLRLGNVDSIRDYIYVSDVARAVIAAATQSMPSDLAVLNVGSGVGRSVAEVVEVLAGLVPSPPRIVSTPQQRRAVDRACLLADITRIKSLYGWTPEVDFVQGLRETMAAAGLEPTPAASGR